MTEMTVCVQLLV